VKSECPTNSSIPYAPPLNAAVFFIAFVRVSVYFVPSGIQTGISPAKREILDSSSRIIALRECEQMVAVLNNSGLWNYFNKNQTKVLQRTGCA
jgi:hypothetical protein